METVLIILFIFLSIWMGSINTVKLFRGEPIPVWNFIIMSVGITGVVVYVFGITAR